MAGMIYKEESEDGVIDLGVQENKIVQAFAVK